MSGQWAQVGTVEILRLRVYPIDPLNRDACRTEVCVQPGTFPLYRRFDAYQWVMTGRINDRMPKLSDGLFAMNNGDVPGGLEVQFASAAFGIDQFAELLLEPACQPGPDQRLKFNLTEATS